jgi:hypothetical protein
LSTQLGIVLHYNEIRNLAVAHNKTKLSVLAPSLKASDWSNK